MDPQKLIIIGSGIAGLAAATRLAVQGYDVHVYEKNSYPGGKLSFFEKDGYRFDAGPSLFTQPQNIEDLFVLANEPLKEYFSYQPVEIACRYFYESGKVVDAYTDATRFAAELQEQLGESPEAIKQYLAESEKIYDNIGSIFVDHSLHKKKTWLSKRIFPALRTVRPGYLFRSLDAHNRSRLKSPEAVQLFNRFATYNGSNPYKAPGMLSLIPHLEQNQGTWYPKGGMISITDALYKLALKKGVQFHFEQPVQRIIYHEGKIRGVVVNEENIHADIVLANGDVYFTWQNLLNDHYRAKKVLKRERSSSALIFYWGIKKQFDQLHLHNIFFSKDYKKEFEGLFKTGKMTDDPTIYINITSKMESGQAPSGCENWFVMVNAPANTGQDWNSVKEKTRQAVIEKLGRILQTDIEPLIATEETLDPVLMEERTGSYRGSLYGTSSNSKLAAFLRHPNFSGNISGLYFCGGSVHPGGGIPLCMKSAKIVSELIGQQKHLQHH